MELHPLNTEFQWNDRKGPFRTITSEQARQFDEDGYFVMEDAFDAETVERLLEEIDPLEEELESYVAGLEGGKSSIARAGEITFTVHIVTKSNAVKRFTQSPIFQGLTHDLIGPNVRLYWDQSVYKKPGMKAPFPWHQDNGYSFVDPQQYLTCWIALNDATIENGCPWVLPRLHRRGTYRHEMTEYGFVCTDDTDAAIPAPVKAGGMVVFSSLTPHATGPNTTQGTRKAYIVQFAPDGARILARGTGETVNQLANEPDRQFPILADGRPVSA